MSGSQFIIRLVRITKELIGSFVPEKPGGDWSANRGSYRWLLICRLSRDVTSLLRGRSPCSPRSWASSHGHGGSNNPPASPSSPFHYRHDVLKHRTTEPGPFSTSSNSLRLSHRQSGVILLSFCPRHERQQPGPLSSAQRAPSSTNWVETRRAHSLKVLRKS